MGAADEGIGNLIADLLAGSRGVRETLAARLRDAGARGDRAQAARMATLLLLHTLASFSDFRALSLAIAAFDPEPPDPFDRLRADAVRLGLPSLTHEADHADPALAAVRARVLAAVRAGDGLAPDERLLFAKLLLDHDGLRDDAEAGAHLLASVQDFLPAASPPWQAVWWHVAAEWYHHYGQPDLAQVALQQQQVLLQRVHVPEARLAAAINELRMALRLDDGARADRACRAIDHERPHVAPALLPRALRWQTRLLVRRGQYQAALEKAALMLALCTDHEVPERERGGYVEERVYALAGLGRHDEAVAALEALRPFQGAGQADMLEAMIAMRRAHAALAAGGDARAVVLPAIRQAAACSYLAFPGPFPEVAARIAAIGLDAGCEVEMLERAVRQRRLPPPAGAGERWPWALRVRVLGGFEIWRGAEPLAAGGGKARKKPQKLLALLAAHPAGLDGETLIDDLWPSLEADAPRASLEMTISRLRKWIDVPEAVRVADGRIALDLQLVWTDVAAFEAAVEAGDAGRALAVYRGTLLQGEQLEGLALRAREQLAHRLAAVVLQQAAALRTQGRVADALALLGRGLAAVPDSAALQAALRA